MFFYTDTGPKSSFDPDLVNRLNPNTMYIKHLENLYVLKFIELKSDKFFEKVQASKEIKICEKKLEFWERKITNQPLIDNKIKQLKTQWNS